MNRPCPAPVTPRKAGRRAGATAGRAEAGGPAEGPLAVSPHLCWGSSGTVGPRRPRLLGAVEPAAPGARAAQGGQAAGPPRARRAGGIYIKGVPVRKASDVWKWRHNSRAA